MTVMTIPVEDYVPPEWHDGDAPITDYPDHPPPFTGDEPEIEPPIEPPGRETQPEPEPEPTGTG